LPLTIYAISEADVNWFCNTSRSDIEAHYNEGLESDTILEAKDFVTKIDQSLSLRTEFICKTDACACYVPEGFGAWETKFGDEFDETEYDGAGRVKNWADCEQDINNASDRTVLAD
jgi:hypothetical protein